MKNFVFSTLTVIALVASVGCASDNMSSGTTTQTTMTSSNSDPKDMSTATQPETPPPAPAAVDTDYPSNGIHTSGNLPGMR